MTHTYHITGMTCSGCQDKVQSLLSKVEGVTKVSIDLGKGEASIEMHHHIPVETLKEALKDYPKYQLAESAITTPIVAFEEESKSWFETYKPLLLIFIYITAVSVYAAWYDGGLNWMKFMQIFMAGFFLVFSFFKLLDLKGFAESYAMYDIIAKKIPLWGYIYPFVELALGIAYIFNQKPLVVNGVALVVMTLSIIGVLQSILNKRKIRCVCLGAVFNLPMSTVTIIEDGLMILMAAWMIIMMI